MPLQANDYSCKFKEFLNRRENISYTTCELRNVKFNEKSQFKLKIEIQQPTTNNNETATEEDIKELIQDLTDSVTRVAFKWSKLANIPNEIFVTFTQLKIFDASETNLNYFNALSFNKAENLIEICLQNNNLKIINSFVFVHSKKLKTLDLSNNYIRKIEAFAFNGLESLETLDLSQNRIEDIDDDTFKPLTALTTLWLDRNRLKVISSHLFSEANRKLEKISINRNSVSDISPFVFDRLSKLRFLLLDHNQCVSKSFINHAIAENVAIKLELHSCFKSYRKTFPKDSESFNITQTVNQIQAENAVCEVYVATYQDSIEKREEEIQKLQKKGK